MPRYKKNYRKKPYRRNYRKKFYGKKKYKKNIKANGIPTKQYFKLFYSEAIGITLGTINYYNFRMNSIYDPNYTGTVNQPLWHDQLAVMYNKYKVNACKYKFIFNNFSASQPVRLCVFPNGAILTAASSYDPNIQRKGAQYRVLEVLGGKSMQVIKGYVNMK